jgi:hypothetical protein
VRATPDSPDLKPEIREVVEPSGHKTLRLLFPRSVERDEQVRMLDNLKKHKAYYERATATLVAIDIEPDGSYSEVYDQLRSWEDAGLLSFETCEAKIDGSFDELMEDGQSAV